MFDKSETELCEISPEQAKSQSDNELNGSNNP